MDNTKLRILSKIGLLFVLIGFFMPISCNQNGFQIAKTLETFGGPNLLSVSLYVIFLGSCVGLVLLVLLLQKITFGIKYDWMTLVIIMAAFSFVIFMQIREQSEPFWGFFFQLQSGAYVMFIGLVVSFVSLLSVKNKKSDETTRKNIVIDTTYNNTEISDMIEDDKNMKPSPEKQILLLSTERPILSVKEVILCTDMEVEEAEKAIKNLVTKGFAIEEKNYSGNAIYIFNEFNYIFTRFIRNSKYADTLEAVSFIAVQTIENAGYTVKKVDYNKGVITFYKGFWELLFNEKKSMKIKKINDRTYFIYFCFSTFYKEYDPFDETRDIFFYLRYYNKGHFDKERKILHRIKEIMLSEKETDTITDEE